MITPPKNFMTPDLNSRPRLAAGCRLNDAKQQPRVLLMPEKALRLMGPSLEIVERCDGRHTVRQIITELQKIYDKADPQKVETTSSDICLCSTISVRWTLKRERTPRAEVQASDGNCIRLAPSVQTPGTSISLFSSVNNRLQPLMPGS